jgi:predicted nucleic acid-binding protein
MLVLDTDHLTMEHDAVLLTRNTKDFEKVPGLKFENWLE